MHNQTLFLRKPSIRLDKYKQGPDETFCIKEVTGHGTALYDNAFGQEEVKAQGRRFKHKQAHSISFTMNPTIIAPPSAAAAGSLGSLGVVEDTCNMSDKALSHQEKGNRGSTLSTNSRLDKLLSVV